jgi:transposase
VPPQRLPSRPFSHDRRSPSKRGNLIYVPGRAVNRASDGYRSEGKTDAKDARIIADQARLRHDFTVLDPQPELLTELRIAVAHRRDLINDRTRMITRLREHLTAIAPGLERALPLTTKTPRLLLARWQTPEAIRKAGQARISQHLAGRGGRNAQAIAAAAVAAAKAQTVRLPGEQLVARIVAELAQALVEIDQRVKAIDRDVSELLARHDQTAIVTSLPGMGPVLTAEFFATVGDLSGFDGPDKLAAYAGLSPVTRDSGRVSGNLHRPQRYSRVLLRVFYTSALVAIQRPGPSQDYYRRKRAEGKRHIQAVIALARRRVNVLWAMLRHNRPYTPSTPERALTAA